MKYTVPVDNESKLVAATVDSTDLPIQEPTPFDAGWYSHKLARAAVRYEVAVSLYGNIVWVHGPFRAGANSDLNIFRSRLMEELDENEVIIADGAYQETVCLYSDGLPISMIEIY